MGLLTTCSVNAAGPEKGLCTPFGWALLNCGFHGAAVSEKGKTHAAVFLEYFPYQSMWGLYTSHSLSLTQYRACLGATWTPLNIEPICVAFAVFEPTQ